MVVIIFSQLGLPDAVVAVFPHSIFMGHRYPIFIYVYLLPWEPYKQESFTLDR